MERIVILLLGSLFVFGQEKLVYADDKPIFTANEHCVAWKTRKTMALVKKVEPVGKNCRILTKLVRVTDGGFSFEGRFPLDAFDSGEKERDAAVIELLGGNGEQKELVFRSKAKSRAKWLAMLNSGEGKVDGYLQVAGKEYVIGPNLKVNREGDGYVFSGRLVTNFEKFAIEPPTVAGGLVARVHDYLELHFHLRSSQTEGFAEMLENTAGDGQE